MRTYVRLLTLCFALALSTTSAFALSESEKNRMAAECQSLDTLSEQCQYIVHSDRVPDHVLYVCERAIKAARKKGQRVVIAGFDLPEIKKSVLESVCYSGLKAAGFLQ